MSARGRRATETRGQYERCDVKGCKRKVNKGNRCAGHAIMRDRYGNTYDPAAQREEAEQSADPVMSHPFWSRVADASRGAALAALDEARKQQQS